MNKTKSKDTGLIAWMAILLVFIALGFVICAIYVREFNSKDRSATSADMGNDCQYSIFPRSGDSDEWTKESAKLGVLYGAVYRGDFLNVGESAISDWNVRINIHEDCYINSDWNGQVEIHQNTKSGEKVQKFDLRQYASTDIKLDTITDTDLLIPMSKGDYVVYYPSKADKEYPVDVNDEGEEHSILTGFIFYTKDVGKLEFDDIEISYHLQKTINQVPGFWWLVAASCAWIILLIVYVAVRVSVKSAEKRIKKDEVIIEQAINVLTKFVDAKDDYTNGHSHRVAEYSKLIAQRLGQSEDECRHLYYIALMHDCGKIGVPDAVLKKPGKLSDDEYEAIKVHTTKGAELLKEFTAIEGIREGALYHHERFDGGGYPTGRKGETIPLVARIICVADSFDAMNSHRCYRSRRPKEYIISELKNNRDKQFDAKVVDAFLELIDEGIVDVGEQPIDNMCLG